MKLRKLTRERTEAAGELARQERALAQRERILATQEAELQQQESELADRHRSVAERERELIRTRVVLKAPVKDLGAVESDWWEKQLGHPVSPKK